MVSNIIDILRYYMKFVKNELITYTEKSKADVLNMLIYIWIFLSAIVVCSVYFWKNNELGFIKEPNDEKELPPFIPNQLETPKLNQNLPKKMKIKSTTVKMHRLNKSSDISINDNMNIERAQPILSNSNKNDDNKNWLNKLINWVFSNVENKQKIANHCINILNSVLETLANSNLWDKSICIESLSFGSRCPEINENLDKSENSSSLFSCCFNLLIPQVVINGSSRSKGTDNTKKFVIYISDLLLKICIESSLLVNDIVNIKISFTDETVGRSHIESHNTDFITSQWIKQQIFLAFSKGVLEFEFRIGELRQTKNQETDTPAIIENEKIVIDKSSSPRASFYCDKCLFVENNSDSLSKIENPNKILVSMEEDVVRPEKLLTIHYAMIPFLLINEDLDRIFLCIEIDNPEQHFQCHINSFRKTESGIEDLFTCVNATFFIGHPTAVLKFILQINNGQTLRSGQIHVTEQLQDSISFLSMTLHLPIERENDIIYSSNLEFATLSVIFSSNCLRKTTEKNVLLGDNQRSNILRASFRQFDNNEGQISSFFNNEDINEDEEEEEEIIEFMNSDSLVFEHKEIQMMTQSGESNFSHFRKNTKSVKRSEWFKRLPGKALKKCKTRFYGKIHTERQTLFSIWNHRFRGNNRKVNEIKKSSSINSFLEIDKIGNPMKLYSSAPNIDDNCKDQESYLKSQRKFNVKQIKPSPMYQFDNHHNESSSKD